jgi:hypothetical protein
MGLAAGTDGQEQNLDIGFAETAVMGSQLVAAGADWGLDTAAVGRAGSRLELAGRTSPAAGSEEAEELRNRLAAGMATAVAEDIAAGRTEELEELRNQHRRVHPSNPVAAGIRLEGDTGCCMGHS